MRDRRWGRILGGVLLVVVGALAALASFATMSLSSCDAYELESEATYQARSKGAALVLPSPVLELEGPSSGWLSFCGADYGHLTVEAEAEGTAGRRVFMGTARPGAATGYLGRARYTVGYSAVEDFLSWSNVKFEPAGWDVRRVLAPGAQRLWLDRAEPAAASTARLRRSWRVSLEDAASPPFWLVLMNADGSPGIAAELRLHFEVLGPSPWPYVAVVLAGVLLVVGGVVLARSGRRLSPPPTWAIRPPKELR